MDKSLLLEYESLLLGKKKNISPFFMEGTPDVMEQKAIEVIRYAFKTYRRGWDAGAIRDCITPEIINALQLKPFVRLLRYPPELDPEKDLFYIAWKLYPNSVNMSKEELTIRVYQSLLRGEIQRFPKEFFSGAEGQLRSEICLRYMIENYMVEDSIESLYQLFATSKVIIILKRYRLFVASCDLFACPIEYLHASLSSRQKDETLYQYYRFAMAIRSAGGLK